MSILERTSRSLVYRAAQTARMGWYTVQYVRTRHIAAPVTAPGYIPEPFNAKRPHDAAVRRSLLDLINREQRDIANGVYKLPRDLGRMPSLDKLFRQAKRYAEETREISRRSHRPGGAVEVRDISDEHYPTYYRQNFHYQTDGWFSDQSAEIYDTQVETLFTGAADAMRRRALPCLAVELNRLQQTGNTEPRFADIACGTGRLLRDVMDNHPDLNAHAIDLSPAYLNRAKVTVGSDKVTYIQGHAEALPYSDNHFDVTSSVYLFHELPQKIREQVVAEIARVTKPGGLYLHVDTIQYGDTDMDLLLEAFPRAVHEPYYESYCSLRLNDLFNPAGFERESEDIGFLTKVTAYRLGSV